MGSQGHCVNMKKTWSLVLALMFPRNPASTPVLCASVVSATTPPSACSVGCWSTRDAVASLTDWWPAETTFAPGVMESSAHERQINDSSGYGWHHA